MGLDMYLRAKKYISTYREENKDVIDKLNTMFNIVSDEDYTVNEVSFRVAYWRKANHIHQWFVENCQDCIDDCKEYYVGRDQLKQLRDLCEHVLANKDKADELFPTQSGFFFGDTDYDEWYFIDLEKTVSRIDKILNDPALTDTDFYYQSSW